MKCAGKNRRGKPCGKNAMIGRRHCKTHGGGKPCGVNHHNFKHGKRSHYLAFSQDLLQKYEEAMADPELIEYRDSIALLEARICSLLESAESNLLWARTQRAFCRYEAAFDDGDAKAIIANFDKLKALVNKGYADSVRWREIYDTIEQQARQKDREIKRLVLMEQFIPAEIFMTFIAFLVDAAKRTIKDRDSLRSFAEEINRAVDTRIAARGLLPSHYEGQR
jgi:hypothetical protein